MPGVVQRAGERCSGAANAIFHAAIDMCSQDNGGCATHATCTQLGVNVSCTCAAGYWGDGYVCEPIDRCADGRNGDCSEHAHCISTGPVSTAHSHGSIPAVRTPHSCTQACTVHGAELSLVSCWGRFSPTSAQQAQGLPQPWHFRAVGCWMVLQRL